MIEAKQLNEGNSVLYNGAVMKVSEKRSPKPLKDEKYSEKYVIELFDGAGLINCTLEEIEPIPITEDVLLEFGFGKFFIPVSDIFYLRLPVLSHGHLSFYFNSNGFNCDLGTTSGYHFGTTKIKHLHQLQNLYFALTNQELKKIEK